MPHNCQRGLIPFFPLDACDSCMSYDSVEDKCGFTFPPRPLKDILTTEERIDRLERKIKIQPEPLVDRVLLKRLQQVESGLVDFRNDFNKLDDTFQEHLASHWDRKKGGKQGGYKYK